MAILPRRHGGPPLEGTSLRLPTNEDIAHMLDVLRMDVIRGESLAELGAPPAVDVAAQTDAWEYDKNARPWAAARRLTVAELGDRAACGLRDNPAAQAGEQVPRG